MKRYMMAIERPKSIDTTAATAPIKSSDLMVYQDPETILVSKEREKVY